MVGYFGRLRITTAIDAFDWSPVLLYSVQLNLSASEPVEMCDWLMFGQQGKRHYCFYTL